MTFGVQKARCRSFHGKTGVQFLDGRGIGGITPGALTATEKAVFSWKAASIFHNMCVTFKLGSASSTDAEDTAALDAEIDVEAEADVAEQAVDRAAKVAARLEGLREEGCKAADAAALVADALAAGKQKRDDVMSAVLVAADDVRKERRCGGGGART
jgi:hypothetical protein